MPRKSYKPEEISPSCGRLCTDLTSSNRDGGDPLDRGQRVNLPISLKLVFHLDGLLYIFSVSRGRRVCLDYDGGRLISVD